LKPYLLDVNVLLALTWPSHAHYGPTACWFSRIHKSGFGTCPFTESGFVRISSNSSYTSTPVAPRQALDLLQQLTSLPGHQFWPASLSLSEAISPDLQLRGHRQITDAYLIALAAEHGGILATLDRGAAVLAPDPSLVELIQG
jgi:toxin-antitoxin system PIN domain toxin